MKQSVELKIDQQNLLRRRSSHTQLRISQDETPFISINTKPRYLERHVHSQHAKKYQSSHERLRSHHEMNIEGGLSNVLLRTQLRSTMQAVDIDIEGTKMKMN